MLTARFTVVATTCSMHWPTTQTLLIPRFLRIRSRSVPSKLSEPKLTTTISSPSGLELVDHVRAPRAHQAFVVVLGLLEQAAGVVGQLRVAGPPGDVHVDHQHAAAGGRSSSAPLRVAHRAVLLDLRDTDTCPTRRPGGRRRSESAAPGRRSLTWPRILSSRVGVRVRSRRIMTNRGGRESGRLPRSRHPAAPG